MVSTIDREEIEKRNLTSMEQILAQSLQNAAGLGSNSSGSGFNTGRSFDNHNGGASINLRGFGDGATLVLLNGNRLALSASAMGGASMVDINSLPASAVERVEILLDSASAVYGSDAIAGVVNIITRKDYDGVELSVNYADEGNASSKNKIDLFTGFSRERWNMIAGVSYSANDSTTWQDIGYAKRDFTDQGGHSYSSRATQAGHLSAFFDVIPGTNVKYAAIPDNNDGRSLSIDDLLLGELRPKAFDDGQFRPKSSSLSVFSHLSAELPWQVNFNADVYYTKRETISDFGAPVLSIAVDSSLPILAVTCHRRSI